MLYVRRKVYRAVLLYLYNYHEISLTFILYTWYSLAQYVNASYPQARATSLGTRKCLLTLVDARIVLLDAAIAVGNELLQLRSCKTCNTSP
jgi:hypothetical protein